MKAIIWKELREHSRWVPFALCVMSGIVWYVFDGSSLIFDLDDQLPLYVMAFGGVCAFMLGVAQCYGDRSPEARALLLHRGVTPTGAFGGKLVAAVLIYSAVVFVPLGCVALYFFVDGLRTIAAYPSQVVGSVLAGTIAFLFWPAGVLLMHRNAVIYGSRLLPIGATFFICLLFLSSLFEAEFGSALIQIAFTAFCFAAAWLAGSTSFSARMESRWHRVFVWLANSLCLLGIAFIAFEFVNSLKAHPAYRTPSSETNYVALGWDGELWRVRNTQTIEGYAGKNRTVMAKMSEEGSVEDELRENEDWHQLDCWGVSGARGVSAEERVFTSAFQHVTGSIIYNRRNDELLVYEGADGSKRLRNILRPEQGQFGGLGSYGSDWHANRFIRFRNGLFYVPSDGSTVELVYPMMTSECWGSVPHPYSNALGRLLRDRDRLTMLHSEVKKGRSKLATMLGEFGMEPIYATNVRLPTELADVDSFEFAEDPVSNTNFIAVRQQSTANGTQFSWFRFTQNGKVLERKTFVDESITVQQFDYTDPHYEVVVPMVVYAIATGLQAAIYPDVWLTSLETFSDDTAEWVVFGTILLLQSIVAVLTAMAVVRHRRIDVAVRKRWYIAAFLCGPLAALCILSVYPRVIYESCSSCSRPTPIDSANCLHCSHALDELERTGVEIFDELQPCPAPAVFA